MTLAATPLIQFGLSKIFIAKRTVSDGTVSYAVPKALPGAKTLSADPKSETSEFYFDNVLYYVLNSNSGYSGEIEVAYLPDWFKKEVYGYLEDQNKMLIEVDAPETEWALLFQVETDKKARRFIFYNVTFGKPKEEFSTKEDKVDVKTVKIPFTAKNEVLNDKTFFKAFVTPDSTKYAEFFTTTQLPKFD